MDSSNLTGDSSSHTAVKTGPLGSTILLRNEDVPEYEALVESVMQEFRPETLTEKLLAQWIVSHQWRLRMMLRFEKGLCLIGKMRLGSAYTSDEDLRECTERIDAKSATTYQKQFRYFAKQVKFLEKRLKEDTKELNNLLKSNPRANKHRGLFLVPKREKS